MAANFAKQLVEEGRLRLGSAGFYHNIDNAPEGVADDAELCAIGVHIPIHLPAFEGVPFRIRLWEMGIIADYGFQTELNLVGCKFISEHAPRYLMCLTTDPTPGLFGKEYDTVLRISDVYGFAAAIAKSDPKNIGRFSVGAVRYGAREYDIFGSEPLTPDPFAKKAEFAWQKELRIVFEPSGKMQNFLSVESSDVRNFVDYV
ncbi:hypothetical protein [Mesorhizobium sp. M0522]|uniref:hypothetical protein n=1 Tax=Mesorhizobium sp. M0522 TaxID=2956958 RepID=UPI0033389C52